MSLPPDPPPAAAEGLPVPGDVLAGKYRVERVVGVGGMGVVLAATHVQLEERVALKLLKREVMRAETVARFLREARSAAKIKSDHVARVTDVGTLESGVPYMVMELLDGEDLGFLVQERGPLPLAQAVDYVLQAGEAVAEAHALGIVHRDLKPANLFLARRPGGQRVVKVVDFGISKQLPRDGVPPQPDAEMTRTSAWLGSPHYMSPEQMRSAKDVDARTDLWSLGLILFELYTGHLPYDAPSLVELYDQVMRGEPAPITTWRPDAPPAVVAVIARCLQRDREQRYASVAEMAADLAAVAPPGARDRIDRIVAIEAERSPSGLPVGPESEPPLLLVRASSRLGASSRPPAPRETRRRGAALWLLSLMLLAAGGGSVYLGSRTRGWSSSTPHTPAPADIAAAPSAPDHVATIFAPLAPAPDAGAVESPRDVPASGEVRVDTASDAGGRGVDAGSGAGGHRAALRKGTALAGKASPVTMEEDLPSSPVRPAPAGVVKPEIVVETCTQTMADGTRKQIPCP